MLDAGLFIENVDVTDNARYTCVAESQTGKETASATLNVDGRCTLQVIRLPETSTSFC